LWLNHRAHFAPFPIPHTNDTSHSSASVIRQTTAAE
jgi:hypothetical protein